MSLLTVDLSGPAKGFTSFFDTFLKFSTHYPCLCDIVEKLQNISKLNETNKKNNIITKISAAGKQVCFPFIEFKNGPLKTDLNHNIRLPFKIKAKQNHPH